MEGAVATAGGGIGMGIDDDGSGGGGGGRTGSTEAEGMLTAAPALGGSPPAPAMADAAKEELTGELTVIPRVSGMSVNPGAPAFAACFS